MQVFHGLRTGLSSPSARLGGIPAGGKPSHRLESLCDTYSKLNYVETIPTLPAITSPPNNA
jgi:hypothetical protein